MAYLPNILTLLRIGLVPILILLMQNNAYSSALILFIIAGITDGLDGYIAKRYGFVTQLGSILDPLADKLLLISAFVMLTVSGDFPFWLLIIAAFRDLIIITGVIVLAIFYNQFEMKPILLSKLNTVLQISLVIVVLIGKSTSLPLNFLNDILIWSVTFTTVFSGLLYVYQWGFKDQNREN